MKKIFIPGLLFSIAFIANSQTLTNRHVYDYDIGDVIQAKLQAGPSSRPTFSTQTIIGKSFSAGNDTIYYTIKRNVHTPQACPTCAPGFTLDTIVQIISELDSLPDHKNLTTCFGTIDTMYTNACKRVVWERGPGHDTCVIFEPISHITSFVKGLGGPYYWKFDPTNNGPQNSSLELIYYQKADTTCGTFISGLSEYVDYYSKVELFPNPCTDRITLNSPNRFRYYKIVNLSGEVIVSSVYLSNAIDVSFLKPGVYFINFYTGDARWVTKKLLRN